MVQSVHKATRPHSQLLSLLCAVFVQWWCKALQQVLGFPTPLCRKRRRERQVHHEPKIKAVFISYWSNICKNITNFMSTILILHLCVIFYCLICYHRIPLFYTSWGGFLASRVPWERRSNPCHAASFSLLDALSLLHIQFTIALRKRTYCLTRQRCLKSG